MCKKECVCFYRVECAFLGWFNVHHHVSHFLAFTFNTCDACAGIRKECEAVDGAPDFLMLHSLGGGSGSGLGSRILEHLRVVSMFLVCKFNPFNVVVELVWTTHTGALA